VREPKGSPCFGRQTGVILHQPLSLSILRKKRKNGQKMNGIPVSPSQKTENAPTWRPRCHENQASFWALFPDFLVPFPPSKPLFYPIQIPNPTSTPHSFYADTYNHHLNSPQSSNHKLRGITVKIGIMNRNVSLCLCISVQHQMLTGSKNLNQEINKLK